MSDWTIPSTVALGFVVVLYIGRKALRSRPPYPLPPGPPGLPWLGNINGIDPEGPWKTYTKWGEKYGDLLRIHLLGKDIIIINSEKVARDLFENRSSNYSDRPKNIINGLCGVDFATTLASYGDRWRRHRKLFHQTYRPEAISRFFPYHHRKACQLLQRLFKSPEEVEHHMLDFASSIIMNSTYDHEPASQNDQIVATAVRLLEMVLRIIRPDRAALVEAFPWVVYLPHWFPGMSFKNEMTQARADMIGYREKPFRAALQKVSNGTVAPSMIRDSLQYLDEKGIAPDESWMTDLRDAAGTAFFATSETTSAVMMSFVLMMVINPGAQEKAQAYIDAVVGKDRLPTLNDRPSLPFVDAILWETLRYGPVTPMAFPHVASADDTYNGYFIPAGTMCLMNLWAMSRAESNFPNAHEFVPERFINDDGSLRPNDAEYVSFGFGRRSCPGKIFAEAVLWGAMAKLLATFKFLKALDENGVEIPVEPRYSPAVSTRPLPFKCRIVPRYPDMSAEKLEQLIAASGA